jgi:glycosyltransferase involved in cell wall biosynthesis
MSQVIIFDPVCGTSKGHNYQTAIKYAQWIKQTLQKTPCLWICPSDCDPKETEFRVEKNIPWVFEYFIRTGDHSFFSVMQRLAQRIGKVKSLKGLAKRWLVASDITAIQKIKSALLAAMAENPEIIFFPGLDFYTTMALLELSRAGEIPTSQRLVLRVMGVMERASRQRDPEQVWLHALRLLMNEKLKISLTAETEKYAAHLEKNLHVEVIVTHIPIVNVSAPINVAPLNVSLLGAQPDAKIAVCLGSARADKGYLELANMANYLRSGLGRRLHLVVQAMSSKTEYYSTNYEFEMKTAVNISLLSTFLSNEDLFSWIERADIVFLPYSQGTYNLRGSAILFDAIAHGKLIIGRAGTGFGDTIAHAGLGFTFDDAPSLVYAFQKAAVLDTRDLEAIRQNQQQYVAKLENNLKELFNEKDIVRIY